MDSAFTKSLIAALDNATDGLIGGQLSALDWHNAVARELFVHHLAAYAEASGKDEREVMGQVKKIVGGQIDYLNGFTDAIEQGAYDDRDDALRARATMYAGALRGTWYGGRYPSLTQVPGDGGTRCLTNCKCDLIEADDGIHWNLNDEGCDDCQAMAAGSPYDRA